MADRPEMVNDAVDRDPDREPEVLNNYGDMIRFQCRCGNQVSIVPERELETQSCDRCDAVIWLETKLSYGYVDKLDPIGSTEDLVRFNRILHGDRT